MMEDKAKLLKEYHLYKNLVNRYELAKKEKQADLSAIQKRIEKLPQKFNMNHAPHHLHELASKTNHPSCLNKKYSLQNSINGQAILTKNVNEKCQFLNDQATKSSFPTDKILKGTLNSDSSSVPKKSDLHLENECNAITASCIKFNKMNSAQLVKDIQTLTEQLKKKNCENRLTSNVQNKACTSNKKYLLSANNKYNSIKSKHSFCKYKNLSNIPQKISNIGPPPDLKLDINNYTKLNSFNKTEQCTNFALNHFKTSKYTYKKPNTRPQNLKAMNLPLQVKNITNQANNSVKVDTRPLNSKAMNLPLQAENIKSHAKNSCNKVILGSHIRKVTYSNPKNDSKSVSIEKVVSPSKQNLNVKFNVTKGIVSSCSKLRKKSPNVTKFSNQLKVNTTNIFKSSEVSKLKYANTMYTKINKHFATPNNLKQLKGQKTCSVKKIKRKVHTKYKVVNKTLTPCPNKKILNSSNGSKSQENSPMLVNKSDSFLKNLSNSSEIDKIEKGLLAISKVFTSTPLSSENKVNSYKKFQHSQPRINLMLHQKRLSMKKSKRISKYKIVNSINSSTSRYSLKNVKNFSGLKTNYPKFIMNRALHPVNAYSAKIKSKYRILNQRKLLRWQSISSYNRVLSYQRFKGYYPRSKKARKFGYPVVKNLSKSKYKGRQKNGCLYSPVVLIHGVRYSSNSTGKTLKRLPAKGQTTKNIRRIIYGKPFVRSPEIVKKITSTSNLASRVLHRSINRIISASTKKKLQKVNTYCMFYNRFGRCNKGVKCTYIHDPSKIAVCSRFLRGTCKIDGCPFSHEITPGKMAICSFFLVGACEKENCAYRHEKLLPDAALCKAFVQGYCPSGKKCQKAHILVCPKYVQGNCDKGDSCAYPHPPRKIKKNVQKDEDEKKTGDILLERVSRYFLKVEDSSLLDKSDENKSSNQFVPKQRRKLEEQPSFIPLFDES